METAGLSLQDAPPLEIPLSFFLTAPLAIATAGVVLLFSGSDVFASRWSPLTLGVTHLGTLGFLAMVMLGAMYQMVAVVVGSPVPWRRGAHAVHALFSLGVAGLCWGVVRMEAAVVFVTIIPLTFGILLFVVQVGIALKRARSVDESVFGMRAALACFALAAVVGIWMAHGFAGMRFPGSRLLWTQVHLSIALVGWVGGLIMAVSWQVLPMFYLARQAPGPLKWTLQVLVAAGAILPVAVIGVDYVGLLGDGASRLEGVAALAAVPGVLAIWVLHPGVSHWSLSGRRRRRVDASLLFWRAGLVVAPATGLSAVAAFTLPAGHWDVLFGWLALWGWAGTIMHGMLTRIVPFLVWLHRFAPLVGEIPVPSVRKLLPDERTRLAFAIHIGSVAFGCGAILTGSDTLARLTGLSLVLTAGALARSLVHVVRQRPPPPA